MFEQNCLYFSLYPIPLILSLSFFYTDLCSVTRWLALILEAFLTYVECHFHYAWYSKQVHKRSWWTDERYPFTKWHSNALCQRGLNSNSLISPTSSTYEFSLLCEDYQELEARTFFYPESGGKVLVRSIKLHHQSYTVQWNNAFHGVGYH